MNKIIPPHLRCIACHSDEIAPWSDYYCAKCDEDPIDRPEDKPVGLSYWEKRRRGLI